jgi:flagellin-like protein
MDFKKLFRKDEKAVSPVIGVILMVAITVILAAAIGSSVFSKGTAESAPQANLNIKAAGINTTTGDIKFEHLGGSDVNFDKNITKVMATVGSNNNSETIDASSLGIFGVGDVKKIPIGGTHTITTGQTVNIKVIDIQTNQMICDKNVRF